MPPTASRPPWALDGTHAPSVFNARMAAAGAVARPGLRYTYAVDGDSAVVLCAPHGGDLDLGVVDRRALDINGAMNVRKLCAEEDFNTAQLATAVVDALYARGDATPAVGGRPALIIGQLHRRKVDLNRGEGMCAESHEGLYAWHEYHGVIREAVQRAVARHGCAHVFDIHGQGHRAATEVGHLLPNRLLRGCEGRALDAHLGTSSLAGMAVNATRGVSLHDAVRGPHAVGSRLAAAGYPSVPSDAAPHPCACGGDAPCSAYDAVAWSGTGPEPRPCAFFWGGATARLYGVDNAAGAACAGRVAVTQLETAAAGRAGDEAIVAFAGAIAAAIGHFMETFYG